MNSPRSAKRQRERERQERAERKKQRRAERLTADPADPLADADAGTGLSEQQTLDALADLHTRFADGQMSIDEFEVEKVKLTDQLRVD